VDRLHEATPWEVNAISQQIVLAILTSIYLEANVGAVTAKYVANEGGIVKDVDVVVPPGHAKEGMTDPQRLVCNRLKDDATMSVFVLELALPCHWTVFPCPVHAVQTCKHPRKPSGGINSKLEVQVLAGWLSEKLTLETSMHYQSEPLDSTHLSRL
jgi:hypothetical protein